MRRGYILACLLWMLSEMGPSHYLPHSILVHIYNSLINMGCISYISFPIFKICKTIVDVRICNGQLKICGPFIFNWMVLHLVTITKWSTIWSNMKGPHIFNCPLHMRKRADASHGKNFTLFILFEYKHLPATN